MRLFNKKKPRVVDWTEKLNKQQEQTNNIRSEMSPDSTISSTTSNTSAAPFPFFAASNTSDSSPTSSSPYGSPYGSSSSDESSLEERRKRLGKRLLNMTNKIEDLSNQIYKLQQRIEFLERKSGSNY